MSDAESELVAELRALRVDGGGDHFFVAGARHRIEVRYASGSSSSLTLRARYDDVARADHEAIGHDPGDGAYRRSARVTSIVAVRPLAITLRSETIADVEGKRGGLDVEHQTGDAKFDGLVYVDSPTTDAEVLRAVLGPEVRQGVLALLVLGFHHLKIDEDGFVEAFLSEFPSGTAKKNRGAQAIEAFDLVLSNLPRLTASGGAHPKIPVWARATTLSLVGGVALFAGIPVTLGVASANQCTESGVDSDGDTVTHLRDGCGGPLLVAIPIAFLAAALVAAMASRVAIPVLRGRSDASRRLTSLRIVAFLSALAVAYVVAASVGFSLLHR